MTDFVGYLPMPERGDREAFVAADYNAEMITQIERYGQIRDKAIFVGTPDDIVPDSSVQTCRISVSGPRLTTTSLGMSRASIQQRSVTATSCAPIGISTRRTIVHRRCRRIGGWRAPLATHRRGGTGGSAGGGRLRFVVVTGPRIDPATMPQSKVSSIDRTSIGSTATLHGGCRRGPGWPDDDHGADGVQGAVHLRTAAQPLRAELPRPGSTRPLQRRPVPRLWRCRPRSCGHTDRGEIDRFPEVRDVETDGAANAAAMIAALL